MLRFTLLDPFMCKVGSICVQKRFHLRANRFHLRANLVHLRANWFHLRAKKHRGKRFPCNVSCVCVQIWFHLRANWFHLRANWFHLRANWFHLRAKMVPWGAKPSHLRAYDLTPTWPDIADISQASIKEGSKIFDAGCLQMHTLLALAVFISTYVADIKRFVDFEP